jgi:hypothetical protein
MKRHRASVVHSFSLRARLLWLRFQPPCIALRKVMRALKGFISDRAGGHVFFRTRLRGTGSRHENF